MLVLSLLDSAPLLNRAWSRLSWIEHHFRTLKHLLATEACQVQGEDAYYRQLVLRLLAGLVLLDTACVLCRGRVTMEVIVFSRNPWNDTHFHGTSTWRPHRS